VFMHMKRLKRSHRHFLLAMLCASAGVCWMGARAAEEGAVRGVAAAPDAATTEPATAGATHALTLEEQWRKDTGGTADIGRASVSDSGGEGTQTVPPQASLTDAVFMVVFLGIMVAVVMCARAWQKWIGFTRGSDGIQILARHGLGSNVGMLIVRVRGDDLLVGYGANGMSLIRVLAPPSDDDAVVPPSEPRVKPSADELRRFSSAMADAKGTSDSPNSDASSTDA